MSRMQARSSNCTRSFLKGIPRSKDTKMNSVGTLGTKIGVEAMVYASSSEASRMLKVILAHNCLSAKRSEQRFLWLPTLPYVAFLGEHIVSSAFSISTPALCRKECVVNNEVSSAEKPYSNNKDCKVQVT